VQCTEMICLDTTENAYHFYHCSFWYSLCDRVVKDVQELLQRILVHHIHITHFYNKEIKNGTSGCHRAELFPRHVNLAFCVSWHLKFLIYFLSCHLCFLQHMDKGFIIHKWALPTPETNVSNSNLMNKHHRNFRTTELVLN